MAAAKDNDLIYGVLTGPGTEAFLLFIPRREAADLSKIWDALHTAKTWSDFRLKMPRKEYLWYMERSFDNVDDPRLRPNGTSAFTPTDEGWLGGDWPFNPMYYMNECLPEAVMALAIHTTISADQEVMALELLHKEGYRVERNDELPKAACGEFL